MPFLVHGLPSQTYQFQSSTDLLTWSQEGNTNITLDENGRAFPVLWTTNYHDFQGAAKFYRLQQQ